MESSINSGSELREKIREVSSELMVRKGQRDMIRTNKASLLEEVISINNRLDNLKLLETYLSQFADERQAQVYRQIETTVTEGLQAVFQEDIRLEIANKMVGARAETVFTIVSSTPAGELSTSIMDSRGGGVAAIVGFLVQAVLVLLTPDMRPILFLDETFRNVSEDYQAPLGEFIRELCDNTGLQVMLVTHQPTIAEFATDVYSVKQVNGKTKITKES